MWLIHIAWPATGLTWLVFLGEQMASDVAILGGKPYERRCPVSGTAALILFGLFFLLLALRVPVAFALGLACLPILIIEPRLDTMTLMQETFNAYNSFILLAVPFFLLTANLMNVGGTTDRLLKLSRAMVGTFSRRPGADQCRAVDFLRRHLRILDRRCGQPIEDLHRCAAQGRATTTASPWR